MWCLGCLVFVLLATANGGGYRYGTSDQAFYIPAVIRVLDPAAFPQDRVLIDAQARLMWTDEAIAAIVGATGAPLEYVFFAGYVLSLFLIWAALVAIGRTLYPTWWLTAALAAAFTLRHRIPRTNANTFEPYFHPRMLAFAVGALGIAAVLRRRHWTAVALVALAALVHVTTGIWFAILLGVAMAILDRRLRMMAMAGAAAAAVVVAWGMASGPFRPAFVTMDARWLEAVAGKDLFASDWPMWAWAANLALPGIAWATLRWRERQGGADRADPARSDAGLQAIVWGATALAAVFVLTLPLVMARQALPVQLQISRVFWLVDVVALVCLLGIVRRARTSTIVAVALVAIAAGRGAYVMTIEHPERPLFGLRLPVSEWHDATRWLTTQPRRVHVLADPGHAWKYGTSLRVAAERDVFVEEVKDSAVAIYSREMAERYLERTAAVAEFERISAERIRHLAARYGLDFAVTETDLPLPVVYRNQRFMIYALEPARHP